MRGGRGAWCLGAAAAGALAVTGVTVLAGGGARPAERPVVTPAATAMPVPPVLALPVGTAARPSPVGLQRALTSALLDPGLGRQLALSVVDAATGDPLVESRAATGVVPASTAKLVTAVAALTVLPHDRRPVTRVLAGPRPGDGVLVRSSQSSAGPGTAAGSQSPG